MPTEATNPNVDADPRLLVLFRMLDDAFGSAAWTLNDDVRYAEELGFRPIDATATLENQAVLAEKAMDIERRMREEHQSRVLVFVVVAGED